MTTGNSAAVSEKRKRKIKREKGEEGRYCTCPILFDYYKLNVNSAAASSKNNIKNDETCREKKFFSLSKKEELVISYIIHFIR